MTLVCGIITCAVCIFIVRRITEKRKRCLCVYLAGAIGSYETAAIALAQAGAGGVLTVCVAGGGVIFPFLAAKLFLKTLKRLPKEMPVRNLLNNKQQLVRSATILGEKIGDSRKGWDGFPPVLRKPAVQEVTKVEKQSQESFQEEVLKKDMDEKKENINRKTKMEGKKKKEPLRENPPVKKEEIHQPAQPEKVDAVDEARRLIEQEKLRRIKKRQRESAYWEMLKKADILKEKKAWPLAVKLYEQCLDMADSESEIKLIKTRMVECNIQMKGTK